MPDYEQMHQQCQRLRQQVVEMAHKAGSGHCGGSLSCVEILWTLYSKVLRVRPQEPCWPGRDRLVLSKGHAAPALYAVLAARGFFDSGELATLRQTGSMLQGHPDMKRTPGVDMSTGSLGMGISVGVGMALAGRLTGQDYRVYVVVGDGELQEGQNWEALSAANKFRLDKLTVIVDANGVQLDGTTEQIMPMGSIPDKMRAFGMAVQSCDGHDCRSLLAALEQASHAGGGTQVIVAGTVKGRGVSYMEGQSAWHGKPVSDEDFRIAMSELSGRPQ